MASKQKRKRFKAMRKRKERREKRKIQERRKLANGEYLASFLDVIYEEYAPDNVSLYRWVHNPIIPDDFKPQIFQSVTPFSPDDLSIPASDAPKEVVLEHTSWFTLSHFVNLEEAVKAWYTSLNNLLKKAKPEKKNKIIERWIGKKGQYVVKVDYTKSAGLIGPQGDGIHKEMFPYKDVDVTSLIDNTFQPFKIEIQ